MANLSFDIAIVGASFGGVAAALAAARYEKTIGLIAAGSIVGGQATSQGLNRWDETVHSQTPHTYGSAKSYQTLKEDIRGWYAANARLAPGVDPRTFNPGFYGSQNPFSADCNVTMTVLDQLLLDVSQFVTVIKNARLTAANVTSGRIESVSLSNGDVVSATIFVDATDLGELLPRAGIAWFIGAEAADVTGEPNAEATANEGHIQPFTIPLAVEHTPYGEEYPVAQPANYDELTQYQDFGVVAGRNGMIGGVFTSQYNPNPAYRWWESIFSYRQYIDHRNFADAEYANDRSTINVGSNDYQAAVIPTGDDTKDAEIVEAARQTSIAYLWWLQNEAPHDSGGGTGYLNLKVRTDMFGSDDGTAPDPYIRESRRIANPLVQVRQYDIVASSGPRAPRNFPDSVGIGHYPADVHECYGPPGTPYVEAGRVVPFQIPLGALIPQDCANYIAGCKNLGVTHITNGAYRVHPVEWAVGEAAGTLAAYCVGQQVSPAVAFGQRDRVIALQSRLLEYGAPIFWWDDVSFDADPRAFKAIHLLGARGTFEGDGVSLNFDPHGNFPQSARDAIDQRENHSFTWPSGSLTRAQAAQVICEQLGLPL